MSDYDNTDTFVLFLDETLDAESSKPVYTGSIELPDGTKRRLAAWRRTSKDGTKKFLSGRVSDFQPREDSGF